MTSACLPPHPAVAYLFLVRRCSNVHIDTKTLNICGLILSFIGAVMLFIRFLAHLIRASGRPIWHSWFVRWCGRLGIALITIGFLLQLLAKFSQ